MSDTYSLGDRGNADRLAGIIRSVDWLIPAYTKTGFINLLASEIEKASASDKTMVLEIWLGWLHSPDSLGAMFLYRYQKMPYVRDFAPMIDEAIRAHFCGLNRLAVSGLVSVVEGIVRKVAAARLGHDPCRHGKVIKDEFKAFVDQEQASPNRYEERLAMLEMLRDFVNERLFQDTDLYTGANQLNRHGILHGLFLNYGERVNFFRLMTVIDLLCFTITVKEGGFSCFAPKKTEASMALATHYRALDAVARLKPR